MELKNFKVGVVSEVEAGGPRVRVWWPGEDDDSGAKQTSPWLRLGRMGGFYYVPQIDDLVVVAADEFYDQGIVICGFAVEGSFDDLNIIGFKIPTVEIKIDRESGKADIVLNGDASIKAPKITLDGDVSISGDLKVAKKAEIAGDLSTQGKVDALGIIKSMADVRTATASLNTHVHPTAATGPPSPPTPVPQS